MSARLFRSCSHTRAFARASVFVGMLVVVTTSASCSSPPVASPGRSTTTTAASPSTTSPDPTIPTTTAATTTQNQQAALYADITKAWENSINDFYEAGEAGTLDLAALDQTLAPDSPELGQETGFLTAQSAAGVVGPSTWRLGDAKVVTYTASSATVEGCSWDPGSHYKSSGAMAPASLGGGAGYTAYVSQMHKSSGRWLLYASRVSAPTSSKEAGPCEGFA